jgi:hypothetical protein
MINQCKGSTTEIPKKMYRSAKEIVKELTQQAVTEKGRSSSKTTTDPSLTNRKKYNKNKSQPTKKKPRERGSALESSAPSP